MKRGRLIVAKQVTFIVEPWHLNGGRSPVQAPSDIPMVMLSGYELLTPPQTVWQQLPAGRRQ